MAGFTLALSLMGFTSCGGGGANDGGPTPKSTTTVGPSASGHASINPTPSHPAVPTNAVGYCHDGTYITNPPVKSEDDAPAFCAAHGGVEAYGRNGG